MWVRHRPLGATMRLPGRPGKSAPFGDGLDRRLHTMTLRTRLGIRAGLDLTEEARTVESELGDISNPQTVRQVMEQREASLVPKVDRGAKLMGKARLAGHRAGGVVAAQRDHVPAVVLSNPPGEGVANGAELPAHPIEDEVLHPPGLWVLQVRAVRQRRNAEGGGRPRASRAADRRALERCSSQWCRCWKSARWTSS
jgi:hypothetical protein